MKSHSISSCPKPALQMCYFSLLLVLSNDFVWSVAAVRLAGSRWRLSSQSGGRRRAVGYFILQPHPRLTTSSPRPHSSASTACRRQLVRLHAEETVEANRVDSKIKQSTAELLSLCSVLKLSMSTNRRNLSTPPQGCVASKLSCLVWDELLVKSLLTSQFVFFCGYGCCCCIPQFKAALSCVSMAARWSACSVNTETNTNPCCWHEPGFFSCLKRNSILNTFFCTVHT